MRRRFLLLFAVFLAVVVIVVAALPWWFSAAAGGIASRWGISFQRYERIGYARFALHDVEYLRGTIQVTATRVEADTPVVWLWRHASAAPRDVRVERWVVDVKPASAP